MPQEEGFLPPLSQFFGDTEDGSMSIKNASKERETQVTGYS